VSTARTYEEIADLLAAGTTPERLAYINPSGAARERVALLIAREKTDGLSPDERSELDACQHLEHLMRLVKARARGHRG
jgi:hypothetical protein